MKDLVVLVPDKNTESVVKVLLEYRFQALGIRKITFDVFIHPERDPEIYHRAHQFLSPFRSQYHHALVIFDIAFEGAPSSARTAQDEVQQKLNSIGWELRSAVVVIDPELEIWVFGASSHVIRELADGDQQLFQQIIAKYGANPPYSIKPQHPKEAMEELLQCIRRPRSSAIYATLAEQVSLRHCTDPAFANLKQTLQMWFQQMAGEH